MPFDLGIEHGVAAVEVFSVEAFQRATRPSHASNCTGLQGLLEAHADKFATVTELQPLTIADDVAKLWGTRVRRVHVSAQGL